MFGASVFIIAISYGWAVPSSIWNNLSYLLRKYGLFLFSYYFTTVGYSDLSTFFLPDLVSVFSLIYCTTEALPWLLNEFIRHLAPKLQFDILSISVFIEFLNHTCTAFMFYSTIYSYCFYSYRSLWPLWFHEAFLQLPYNYLFEYLSSSLSHELFKWD